MAAKPAKPSPSHPSRLVHAVGDPVSSLWHRLRRGTRILRRQSDWERFAGEGWAERIMAAAVTDRFHAKQGRSIGRLVLADGKARLGVYLKRHYRLPWWHGLLATLFPGRAWSPGLQEWQHLCWANAQGLPVPRPVAAGQLVGPWFRLQSFLAVEELSGMLPLHQAVPLAAARLDPAAFARWKHGLTAELARLTRELHRRKVFHKDLYFCHFYIPDTFTRRLPESWTNRVMMIDLHRLARHRLTGPWWLVKDLAQLLYSSEVPGVTARDRVRFWKLYRANWPGSPPGNWLRPLIRLKWQLYRRHNRRRKSVAPEQP
ncbi:MAG TPA: lipopolysaccharide kinase InaA family protein [Gemmataceae bacterium]|nr:lipopolysaccharide kinase InaA family protein [Gemmataceae bacterium]